MIAFIDAHRDAYPKLWVDAQLSHADPDKVSSAYNHAEYVEQRRRMMQDWADRLDLFERDRSEEASMHLSVDRQDVPTGYRTWPPATATASAPMATAATKSGRR